MVEQNFRFAAPLADRSTSSSTAVSSRPSPAELEAPKDMLHEVLGV
jgi:hypothetical protein